MNKLFIGFLSIGCVLFLTSCAGRRPTTLTWTNPVWDGYLADPQVLYTNGWYYAYGTGKAEDGRHFPILKSRNFTDWQYVGGALAPLTDPALELYWAPEVVEHNGVYYLYYAGDMKMRVATADSPEGPFKDAGIWLFPDLEFSIDAHPYKDPVSGKWVLFFARDFFDQRPGTALSVVELGDDMISTKGPMHTVLRAFDDWQIYERDRTLYDRLWPAWYTVEGPAVLYRDGQYYCFYSGGNWQTPGYGVGCAVSDSLTGPYRDPWSQGKASVLSSIPGKLIGPGHNSVILGPDNATWFIVYHSWNADRTKRQMCLDPIAWTADGPKAYQPSRGIQTVTLPLADSVTVVDRPDTSATNDHYVSNRVPLVPSRFIELPVGSVEPDGWLRAWILRQREGLTGHLGEISVWLQKQDNAWLSPDGKGQWGWEELPYWLKGYGEIAYLLNDPAMIRETLVWIEGTLNSRRANGDFGPDHRFEDGTRDYWANMIMLFCLQSYYEHSGDARVLDLMSRYFKYQLTVPDEAMLTGYWQHMRGGDNLYSIYWLYNRTGEAWLLDVAEKIHRNTADWRMDNDLPNWHNVNVAQCFREPATWYLQSGAAADLEFAYKNHFEIRKRFGQVPGGMFGGDENCRVGYDDPRQAVETCGLVEQMLSDEMLMRISGDPFWADHCEEVAFNSYPAAVMPDFRALRYLTAPNMVVSDSKNHHPGIDNGGPFLVMNPFSSRCCQHNHSHGWPYYSKSLWLATPDNGACAALYAANTVTMKVGDGATVRIREETNYPFEEQVRFTLSTERPVRFPLYLRVPGWCDQAAVKINGRAVSVEAAPKRYLRIERTWADGDTVTLDLPMAITVRTWTDNHNAVSVNYGPLTFSLRIEENYIRTESTKTAIGDSKWQAGADPSQWPSFEIHPASAWNYGLILDKDDPAKSFTLVKKAWPRDGFPFTLDSAPFVMTAKAKKIPHWTLDRYGLCDVLQDSPIRSDEPVETVTLVPMGAARLRISAFPTIGDGPDAREWKPASLPRFRATASHVFDDLGAPSDGVHPSSSGDHSIPRFTWWDHRGTGEWVQYNFDEPREISRAAVYWFDDTGRGQCRAPASWRLLYRDGEAWKPVSGAGTFGTERDRWNAVTFEPVRTKALRLEVQLQPGFSGGILEWKID